MAAAVRDLGCSADSIDYQGIADPSARVDKLVSECSALEEQLILVGSSMGGHVATAGAARMPVAGLFVLAPAYFMPGFENITPAPPNVPFSIVHGWRDDVVPVANSIRYAQSCNAALHVLDGDHRLTANIDEINALLGRFVTDILAT